MWYIYVLRSHRTHTLRLRVGGCIDRTLLAVAHMMCNHRNKPPSPPPQRTARKPIELQLNWRKMCRIINKHGSMMRNVQSARAALAELAVLLGHSLGAFETAWARTRAAHMSVVVWSQRAAESAHMLVIYNIFARMPWRHKLY